MTDVTAAIDADATEQAELIRTGAVSALELVDAAIARIEALNPTLNAVIWTRFDEARDEARNVQRDSTAPFAGVPFLWKDIGAVTAGMPLWLGNRVLKDIDYRAPADTVLGSRLRDAGFIVLGKTNIPELGSTPTTQPLSCGPTANPWDPERSPAGSSGGSAAAVAAGLVAIAHASDGGGSIRIPASWCGLVGLKTSRGRNPYPETISRLTAELAVTRTVRDTAALLDAVHGHTDADLYAIAPPERPYVDEVGRPVERMRIGLLTDGGGIEIDADCIKAAERIAAVLEADGHAVETVDGTVLFGGADATANGVLWMAGLTRRVDAMGELVGRPLTADEVEPYNWTAAERGRSMTAAEWSRAQERQQQWSIGAVAGLAAYDLLITPTTGTPPLTTAALEPPTEKPWKAAGLYSKIARFTLPFNATGHPAISLPLGQTSTGLPVGVQLVAPMGREDRLIRVAAWLETACPWSDRRAAIHA